MCMWLLPTSVRLFFGLVRLKTASFALAFDNPAIQALARPSYGRKPD